MRTVLLTGAGAAKPWDGPLASEVDATLMSDGRFRTASGRTLATYLNHLVRETASRPETVNFETVISAVEELYAFETDRAVGHLTAGGSGGGVLFSSLGPRIFELRDEIEREVFDLDAIYDYVDERVGRVYSPGPDLVALSGDTLRSGLCHRAFAHFVNLVITRVAAYAQGAGDEDNLNERYDAFVSDLAARGPLRLYSLNYDRVPSDCSTVDFFDGFTYGADGVGRVDLTRILRDDDAHVSFNVHGSIYFHEDGFEWTCRPGEVTRVAAGRSDVPDQAGRPLVVTPILTGLQKASRILHRPSAEFYQRLCWDCARADVVVVAGYSFGDVHVNRALQSAVDLGVPVKHVTYFRRDLLADEDLPAFDPWHESVAGYLRGMPTQHGDKFDPPRLSRDDDWVHSEGGGHALFSNGFDLFLEARAWEWW